MPAPGRCTINVAQAIRRALFDTHQVLINSTTSPQFVQTELLAWANEAKDKIEKKLRTVDQDFGLLFRNSTDSSFRWDGMTYAPSSFQLLTTARSYTLPPDVLIVRRIRSLTSGEEGRTFRYLPLSHPEFVSAEQSSSTDTTRGEILWTIVGERTLRLALPPDTTLDIEIAYVPRSRRLQIHTTGTVAVTQDSTSVTGTTTTWVDSEIDPFSELLVSTSTAAPNIVTQTAGLVYVDPSALYNPISTIDTDTTLTLLGAWLTGSLTGRGYMIASRFLFPEEHTHLVSEWVAYRMLRKIKSPDHAGFREEFESGLTDLVGSTAERQTADPVFVDDMIFE